MEEVKAKLILQENDNEIKITIPISETKINLKSS